MGHVFGDMFHLYNSNFILVMIHKSMVYKMEALPMILVYYCLETQVLISRPYKFLLYTFFFIFLL